MFQTGQSGNPAGRPKGAIGKVKNIDIRAQVYDVFNRLGEHKEMSGTEFFLNWARKNPRLFYTGIFIKICPAQLDITDNRQHESFMDRMAKEILLKEAQVVEAKQVTTNQDNNQDNMSTQLSMGKDAIISPSNGGHMGTNDTDKELNHPIINAKSKEVVSGDKVKD